MGILEKFRGEETQWRKQLRARQERLGTSFNFAEEIVAAAFSLPQSGRQAVLECVSTKHARQEQVLAYREEKLAQEIILLEEKRQELKTLEESLAEKDQLLTFRWEETEQIQARAFNAMKAAERIKRKAQKKIADFEALVDR